uniref:Uncharacterized protein n=1 Tax=Labrus bergylta TaxID=56723 RepID=A0A3Q3EXH7_9LABR
MVEKLKAVERCRPGSATELLAVQEGIRVLENLVGMGEEQNRVQLLALLVPTLISYLLDENAISSAPHVSKGLHDFTVIGAAPELKIRLESAIRANQASTAAQGAPTIKLKTSFF